MNKILFSEYYKFVEYNNIQIIKHNLIRDKIVFKFRERNYECEHMTSGSYSNIIQDRNNLQNLKLYYRVCCDKRKDKDHQFTCVAVSNDYGNSFTRPELSLYKFNNKNECTNIVLKEYYSNHNFSVFYDSLNLISKNKELNNIIYGIGGTHNSDKNNTEFQIINYVWPNDKKYLLNPHIDNKKRSNGLYLYKSDDGLKWDLCKNNPIYHGLYQSKDVKLGMVAFDTLPKIIPNYNKYILYTRANTSLDVRAIIYSETEDFVSWSSPQFINIMPSFNYNEDNMYFLGIFNYPNTTGFIAFPPFFKTRQPGRITYYACTKILYSNDGRNWITLNHIFERIERYKYDIAGFIEALDGKECYIFFHENVYKSNNNITRYRIRKDGFTSIYGKNGFFVIKVPVLPNYFINYKTEEDGYLEVELLDNSRNIIQEKIRLDSDEISGIISCKMNQIQYNDIYIKIHLYDGHIYSITY